MEQNNLKKQLGLRLVVWTALAILLYGVLAAALNPNAKMLAARESGAVNLLVLTGRPMFISYNPKYKKAIVTNLEVTKENFDMEKFTREAGLQSGAVLTLQPKEQNRAAFWDNFKTNLHEWRYKPYLALAYLWRYAALKTSGKTDMPAADFILISFDLAQLTPADFALSNPDKPQPPKRGRRAAPPQQVALAQNIQTAAQTDKVLVLEVLNASGQSGLAAEVTRYLRDLTNLEVLNVDVISYGNYPAMEETTKILDHTGRLSDIKKAAGYLGLGGREIFSTEDKTAISDGKIVLGKDFALPKDINK
ncbi:MAG: LytR C-terminal domain-containing protein [Elusimicrobiota bacterium]|jgi:hypothetical protein|nr:LytR C-terminal domain-containing protein [Elusimicrobiota bacterium]